MDLDPELLKQLITTFSSELNEQLAHISNSLIQLENKETTKEIKAEAILVIFRAAHNIKGTARGLNITTVSDIAHYMESLFSKIKNHQNMITSSCIDLCFEAIDNMRFAMDAFADKKPLTFDLLLFLDKLEKFDVNEVPVIKKNEMPTPILEEKNNFSFHDVREMSVNINKGEKIKDDAKELKNPAEKMIQEEMSIDEKKEYETIRVPVKIINHTSSYLEELQALKITLKENYQQLVRYFQKNSQMSGAWQKFSETFLMQFKNQADDELIKLYEKVDEFFLEKSSILKNINKKMYDETSSLDTLMNSLQDEIRMMRLVEAKSLLMTLPRYVRDVAHELHKAVDIQITGFNVRMDKVVLEKIKEPLIHLLRNSIDHGIEAASIRQKLGKPEKGLIIINLREENNQIYITISDDGSGVNIEKIIKTAQEKNLASMDVLSQLTEQEKLAFIFKPGFSTKESVSTISGRGFGLDIVKGSIESLNGDIKIYSTPNIGTKFELRVPFTLVSERGLIFLSAGQEFALGTHAVMRAMTCPVTDILEVGGNKTVMVDAIPIPLYSLSQVLQFKTPTPAYNNFSLIVLKKDNEMMAFIVDDIIGEREIVIKPLASPLSKVNCISGATLSGTNEVILVLDAKALIQEALGKSTYIEMNDAEKVIKEQEAPHILVVDDSITTRTLEKNILESRNYLVTVAVNGEEAWNLLQRKPFSLVITDVNMPIMDGFTLTELIKKDEKLRGTPVIIVTSLGSDAEKKRGIDAGADAYIIKNAFESGMLLETVEQLI